MNMANSYLSWNDIRNWKKENHASVRKVFTANKGKYECKQKAADFWKHSQDTQNGTAAVAKDRSKAVHSQTGKCGESAENGNWTDKEVACRWGPFLTTLGPYC